MRRAVITGLGIVSCLGNDVNAVLQSLKSGRSGIAFKEEYKEIGMRSQLAAQIQIDFDEYIERKPKRFMGDAAAYAYIAMGEAIKDSKLTPEQVSNPRAGLVAGSGGASSLNLVEAADTLRSRGIKRVGPYRVTRTMSSTVSACLATPYKIQGINYSITSACATSAHCIGHAMEQIMLDKQDVVFAGGGEEEHWTQSILFDAMGAMSSKFNDSPGNASRPFDTLRDGFVIGGGGGMLVVEELEHAKRRGAHIYAELVGYGASSDGEDMVAPSGKGAIACMKLALNNINGSIDYLNAHGTSTAVGDRAELNAVKEVFQENRPIVSSTKSVTGHALGAAGVHEAIYSLLMQQHSFISASANIETLDDAAEGIEIARSPLENIELNCVMSNSFGFGGTNASLVFQKYHD